MGVGVRGGAKSRSKDSENGKKKIRSHQSLKTWRGVKTKQNKTKSSKSKQECKQK
jgi:hypothetical protein